jgi:hypothetical protein
LSTEPIQRFQPVCATPGPWKISDVRSVEGEYLIVGGAGQDFGLIASVPEKADAELIVALQDRVDVLTKALEWQPIETAPKDGTEVFYFSPSRGRWIGNEPPICARGNWKFFANAWRGSSSHSRGDETHWMQPPASPVVPLEDRS